jgi:hypothetical protein
MNKQERSSSPAPVQRLVGRWHPISKFDGNYTTDNCIQILFYHPAYHTEEGKFIKAGISFLNWPEVPNTHFYLVPNPPNVKADRAGHERPEQSKADTAAGSASSDLLDGGTIKPNPTTKENKT